MEKSLKAEATLQGFEHHMDKNYVPSGTKETELFEVRQRHFFSILSQVLKTPKEIDIIADHADKANGQQVWADYDEQQTNSVVTETQTNHFHRLILTSTIDYNLPKQDQIINFKEYMRSYDSYPSSVGVSAITRIPAKVLCVCASPSDDYGIIAFFKLYH